MTIFKLYGWVGVVKIDLVRIGAGDVHLHKL